MYFMKKCRCELTMIFLFTGGYGIWLAATYAFLADISAPDQLAFRMGMLHIVSKFASPIGPPIGNALYKAGNIIFMNFYQ